MLTAVTGAALLLSLQSFGVKPEAPARRQGDEGGGRGSHGSGPSRGAATRGWSRAPRGRRQIRNVYSEVRGPGTWPPGRSWQLSYAVASQAAPAVGCGRRGRTGSSEGEGGGRRGRGRARSLVWPGASSGSPGGHVLSVTSDEAVPPQARGASLTI